MIKEFTKKKKRISRRLCIKQREHENHLSCNRHYLLSKGGQNREKKKRSLITYP